MKSFEWLQDGEQLLLTPDERRTLIALVEQGRTVQFDCVRGNEQGKYFARVTDPTNPQHWQTQILSTTDADDFEARLTQAHRFVRHIEIKRASLLGNLGDGEL